MNSTSHRIFIASLALFLGLLFHRSAESAQVDGRPTILFGSKKESKSNQTEAESVQAKKLEFNFNVTSMHVDRNGKYAVAWGSKTGSQIGRLNSGSGTDQVAVVDLDTQKVIIQKPLSSGVQSAISIYPYVLLVPKSGNVLYRFKTETLGDSKRMFLKDRSKGILSLPKNQVGVITGDHNYSINIVDTETMKSARSIVVPYNLRHSQNGMSIAQAAPDVVDINSRLLNVNDGTAVMLRDNPGLPQLVSVRSPNSTDSRRMRNLNNKLFGRHVTANGIASATGSSISQIQNRELFATPHQPVAFAIRTERNSRGGNSEAKLYLETISLVDGEILNSNIFETFYSGSQYINYNNRKNFFAFENKVVYLRGNKLFVIPLDPSIKSAPLPLHFPIRKLPILGIDKPQTISFKAKGGKGKLEYQLVSQYRGIKVDKDSGLVTIDTPPLWKNFIKRYNPISRPSTTRISRSNQPQPVDEKQLAEWFGKSSKDKRAFVVPIHLAVTDEEAQEDRIDAFAVVMVDQKIIETVEAKQRSAKEFRQTVRNAERAIEGALGMFAKAARDARAETKKDGSKPSGLSARADEIEKRFRRIEATLDAILTKLEKLEGNN